MNLALALVAGFLLGMAHFGGLWLTVCRAVRSSRPVLLVMLSFFVRIALLAALVALVGKGSMWYTCAALAGVCLARLFCIRRVGLD